MAIPELQIPDTKRPLLTIAIPTYNRAEYLRQLLDSLLEQVRNESRVEVLISDNASTDDTANLIHEKRRNGSPLTYLANEHNIGPDANFLQCFESAAGKYVWIIGDDDLLLPGAVSQVLEYLSKDEFEIAYVSHIGFAGDPPTKTSPTAGMGVRIYSDPVPFVKRVHVFMSLISCNIINKDRVAAVEHPPFSTLLDTNLIQLGWTFTALRAHRRSLYFEQPLVSYRTANTGGYGVCRVFGATLRKITEEWLRIPRLNHMILNATLQRFLPYCLLAANQQSRGRFLEEDAHALLSSAFRTNFRYWLFDYPLIVLPVGLASLWLQMIRAVNRIDRACGLPLLGW
jgi:abequosyltransferase